MTESNFTPPEVDTLNELMPAFHFVSRLASDENKAVYLVKQKSLDRKAAIKIYSPKLSHSPEFREAFAATTKVMAKLKHPNLIGVYDSGIHGDMLYSVSEFVAGKPLWNSTRGESVHIKHVQSLTEGICVGMCHAHKNEICHGALSLKNVLIDETRMPKIGGFSQATGNTSQLDPSALRFRAPELAEDGAKPTPQCDIYSIGVMLREMAVGQTEGVEALGKIDKIGPGLKSLVEKATSPDPSKRHRKLEDFYEEMLDAFDENSVKKPAGGKLLAAGGGGAKGIKPGGAPVGRPGAGAKPATAVRPVKPSSPLKIWIHLIIIVVLLIAIRTAYKAYQDKKERREQSEQSLSAAKHRIEVIRKPAPAPRWKNDNGSTAASPVDDFPNDPDPQPLITEPKHNSAKEFERLRHALASGSRSEMPEGSLKNGNSYFCHVDIPMTWNDAFWFAIKHGGHLAIPSRKATAEWMRDKLAGDSDRSFWVGASKSGQHAWTLADGRPWRTADPSLSLGEYVSVGESGALQAQEGPVELEFVIQWSLDGSNPGSVESLLKKTNESMSGSAPVYPPGTRSFGVRNFFYVDEAVDWKKAVHSARSSGGHLVVIGGIAEKFNVEKMTENLDAEDGIWMGGFHLEGKGWRWTTGETWRSSDWPQNKAPASKEAALLIKPGAGWDERPREQKASGYLIEWSPDSKSAR